MPTVTAAVATGLGLLIAVPVIAFTSTGGTCAPQLAASGAAVPASATGTPTSAATAVQIATGPATWDAQQLVVAGTIVHIGQAKRVPPAGFVVAVATAMQESRLRNLPGGDHDSIGVFQQRPSQGWGNPTQLHSVQYQSGRFYDALLTVPHWQQLPVGAAAQAVQRSAHPDAYTTWATDAATLVAQFTVLDPEASADAATASTGAFPCLGAVGTAQPTDTPMALPTDVALPAGIPTQVTTAVAWALAQRGTPYSYGGDCTAPHSGDRRHQCDCSSLVQIAYREAGVSLPRTTIEQVRIGQPVASLADLRPGDLLFIPGSDGTAQAPGHIALYLGNNLAIHAPHTGDVVRLISLSALQSQIVAIRRPIT